MPQRELLVRKASNAQGMLGGAADVDLGALGGELALDGCELEDRLGARHPGIGHAKAAHDLVLTARIRDEQGFGNAVAHVMDAALAALENASVFRRLDDLLPTFVVQTV